MKNHSLNNHPPADHYPGPKPGHQPKDQADLPKGEHAMIETYVLKEIHDEIESLPGLCKEVFKLIFFHDMDTAQAAQQLNIPYKTALRHQQQAFADLRFTVLKQCLSYLPETVEVGKSVKSENRE
jgi:DNA-directed RNA polymerase specialized sigma24 family protein